MTKLFLDISELSKKLDLINKKTGKPANHILRFWEKEFDNIKPVILKGNRRYYDQKQIDKIKYIKFLLKDKGLTIKGIYGREMFETWYKMASLLQSGLDLDPIITHQFDIDQFQQGFETMASGQSGKVILNW